MIAQEREILVPAKRSSKGLLPTSSAKASNCLVICSVESCWNFLVCDRPREFRSCKHGMYCRQHRRHKENPRRLIERFHFDLESQRVAKGLLRSRLNGLSMTPTKLATALGNEQGLYEVDRGSLIHFKIAMQEQFLTNESRKTLHKPKDRGVVVPASNAWQACPERVAYCLQKRRGSPSSRRFRSLNVSRNSRER